MKREKKNKPVGSFKSVRDVRNGDGSSVWISNRNLSVVSNVLQAHIFQTHVNHPGFWFLHLLQINKRKLYIASVKYCMEICCWFCMNVIYYIDVKYIGLACESCLRCTNDCCGVDAMHFRVAR